jgi:signal transduction histidine kinase
MREHPRGSDVAFAVLVAIPSVLVPTDAPTGIAPATPVSLLLVLAACAVLVLRRIRPLAVWVATLLIALAAIAVQAGPTGAIFPALVALYTVTLLRPRRDAVLAGVVTAGAVIAALGVFDDWRSPTTYIVLAWSGLAVAAGIAVGSQRAMVAAAEERALRAEETREEEAQRRVAEERLRIARELHDVIAHHISVINVQSGVALHLLDSQPEQARVALGHVRKASADVLAEMSSLLGLLRTSDEGADTAPAPGLSELDALVDSMRRTGLVVTLHEEGARSPLAPIADLTAYRVVQEALTNAYKHGTGSADLRIVHADPTLLIEVTNPANAASAVGSGLGLVGMRERVLASGGSLQAAPDGHGCFVVRAELPSSARAAS